MKSEVLIWSEAKNKVLAKRGSYYESNKVLAKRGSYLERSEKQGSREARFLLRK